MPYKAYLADVQYLYCVFDVDCLCERLEADVFYRIRQCRIGWVRGMGANINKQACEYLIQLEAVDVSNLPVAGVCPLIIHIICLFWFQHYYNQIPSQSFTN